MEWVPCPSPEDLPDVGIKPESLALAGGFFTPEPPGKPASIPIYGCKFLKKAWAGDPGSSGCGGGVGSESSHLTRGAAVLLGSLYCFCYFFIWKNREFLGGPVV